MTDEDMKWFQKVCSRTDQLVSAGMDADTARRAAESEMKVRRLLAGRGDLTITFPGALLEDPDGNPVGVAPTVVVKTSADDDGNLSAVWQTPTTQGETNER